MVKMMMTVKLRMMITIKKKKKMKMMITMKMMMMRTRIICLMNLVKKWSKVLMKVVMMMAGYMTGCEVTQNSRTHK
jgi:hypothetical protein